MVKSQLLCSQAVGLEPFCSLAISFGLLVLLPTVTLFWFSTSSSCRSSHSRCLVSRQVFRQILYCWVSRNCEVAEDLQGGFPKPLLPG